MTIEHKSSVTFKDLNIGDIFKSAECTTIDNTYANMAIKFSTMVTVFWRHTYHRCSVETIFSKQSNKLIPTSSYILNKVIQK